MVVNGTRTQDDLHRQPGGLGPLEGFELSVEMEDEENHSWDNSIVEKSMSRKEPAMHWHKTSYFYWILLLSLISLAILGCEKQYILEPQSQEIELKWLQFYETHFDEYAVFYLSSNNGYFEDRTPLREERVDRIVLNENDLYFKFKYPGKDFWTVKTLVDVPWYQFAEK